MKILRSIYYRSRRYRAGLMRRVYRWHGIYEACMSGGSLVWPQSAAAAVPLRVDGVGHVSIGESVMLGFRAAPCIGSGEILLQARGANSRISIGTRTATSNNLSVIAMMSVAIGDGCQIGDMVTIFDSDFHEIDPVTRCRSAGEAASVVIGNNVWLGSRVMVLKGVTIGDNTVVAASAVVTKSLPANVIAAGVPAKVIRQITL